MSNIVVDDKKKSMNIRNSNTKDLMSISSIFFQRIYESGIDLSLYNIDLPTICVIGDTSSGKTSLLSNLIMVDLPSSSSCTTRCPFRIQMKKWTNAVNADDNHHNDDVDDNTSNNEKSIVVQRRRATISVEWKTSFDTVMNSNAPPIFQPIVIEDNEWDKITETLVQTQSFILQQTLKEVTNDIISLVIESTKYDYDLSLIDLPGFIRSAPGRNESKTLMMNNNILIKEYLNNPRCIILATHSSNVDWHNSQVTTEILHVDPETVRSILVLTKPDLIDVGAENDIVQLLSGHTLASIQTIHMIKGRGQASIDNNDSIEKALNDERHFFNTIQPWKSISDRNCLGTYHLRQKLSEMQLNMIRQSIPFILQEIQNKQQQNCDALTAMGELCETNLDRRRCYQKICQNLISHIRSSLSGKGGGTTKIIKEKKQHSLSAAAQLHEACYVFQNKIKNCTLAQIRTIEESCQVIVLSSKGSPIHGIVVHLDETFACVDYVNDNDKDSDILFHGVGYQSEQGIDIDVVWSDGNQIYIARKDNIYDSLKKIPLYNIRTDPSWLKERIISNRTDDLTCFHNADVFKCIIEEFTNDEWLPNCINLLQTAKTIISFTLIDSIEYIMPNINHEFRYHHLRSSIQKKCEQVLNQLYDDAFVQLNSHLEFEKHPYTQDTTFVENIIQSRNSRLKREIEIALQLDGDHDNDNNDNDAYNTTRHEIQEIINNVFEHNNNQYNAVISMDDILAEEMENILNSYGKIATQRVIDRTPMIIWNTLFRQIIISIQDELLLCNHDNDETVFKSLFIVDESITNRYNNLIKERNDLMNAYELLENL